MRSLSLPLLSLAVLGFFSLGASCNNNGKESPKVTGESATTPPPAESANKAKPASAPIDKLDRIDLSDLTSNERRTFFAVVNDVLSPCGEPVSVAQCVAESRACGACVPGVDISALLSIRPRECSGVRSSRRVRLFRRG